VDAICSLGITDTVHPFSLGFVRYTKTMAKVMGLFAVGLCASFLVADSACAALESCNENADEISLMQVMSQVHNNAPAPGPGDEKRYHTVHKGSKSLGLSDALQGRVKFQMPDFGYETKEEKRQKEEFNARWKAQRDEEAKNEDEPYRSDYSNTCKIATIRGAAIKAGVDPMEKLEEDCMPEWGYKRCADYDGAEAQSVDYVMSKVYPDAKESEAKSLEVRRKFFPTKPMGQQCPTLDCDFPSMKTCAGTCCPVCLTRDELSKVLGQPIEIKCNAHGTACPIGFHCDGELCVQNEVQNPLVDLCAECDAMIDAALTKTDGSKYSATSMKGKMVMKSNCAKDKCNGCARCQ